MQHRGLPHAHIVCQIENAPRNAQENKLRWIDEHIQARFPPPGTDATYAALIVAHNLHKCASAVNGCLNSNGT